MLDPTGENHPALVTQHDVPTLHAQAFIVGGGSKCGRSGAREDDANLRDVLSHDFERIKEGGAGNNRGPMLVVMEDRNLHGAAQSLLDNEAVGRPDILEIDPADCWFQQLTEAYDVVGTFGANLEIEDIEIGELFEQVPLALHHWLSRQRPDVAESEYCRAVGDHGYEISLGGVSICVVRVLLYLQARLGHARRVGQRQVALVVEWFGGNHGDFPRAGRLVVFQCVGAFHAGNLDAVWRGSDSSHRLARRVTSDP